MNEEIFILT